MKIGRYIGSKTTQIMLTGKGRDDIYCRAFFALPLVTRMTALPAGVTDCCRLVVVFDALDLVFFEVAALPVVADFLLRATDFLEGVARWRGT
jgi:hypothetical protein